MGTQINQRKIIHQGFSQLTGEYQIEEVEKDDDNGEPVVFRRLIFLSDPDSIQSEAKLKDGTAMQFL